MKRYTEFVNEQASIKKNLINKYFKDHDFDEIKELISTGQLDINEKYRDGNTPLIRCCNATSYHGGFVSVDYSYVDFAKWLVENGADVNIQNNNGFSAFIAAARAGNIKLVQYLLDKGVDLNMVDQQWMTALHWAIEKRRYKIVLLLIEEDFDWDLKNSFGQNPLILLLRWEDDKKTQKLADLAFETLLRKNPSHIYSNIDYFEEHLSNKLKDKYPHIFAAADMGLL